MDTKYKVLAFLAGILLIGSLSFIVYNQLQMSKRQLAIESQMVEQKTLIDGIVRSQTTWTTKSDLDQFIKDNNINLKAIQSDLDKLHADVTAVNVILANSTAQTGNNIPSTSTGPFNPKPPVVVTCPDGTPCPNSDPYGYQKQAQLLALNEKFGDVLVPFGSVGFSAWQAAPWNIDIKERDYTVSSVVGTDENQRMYFYNKFTVVVDGKSYTLPIKKATTEQVYPEAKFSWWNPRLFLGADGGLSLNPVQAAVSPSVSLGIMSYGRYKTQPDFSILQVGLGYEVVSKTPQVVITPIAYNIGKQLLFMNNTYIAPSVQVGFNGSFSVMGGIRVAL